MTTISLSRESLLAIYELALAVDHLAAAVLAQGEHLCREHRCMECFRAGVSAAGRVFPPAASEHFPSNASEAAQEPLQSPPEPEAIAAAPSEPGAPEPVSESPAQIPCGKQPKPPEALNRPASAMTTLAEYQRGDGASTAGATPAAKRKAAQAADRIPPPSPPAKAAAPPKAPQRPSGPGEQAAAPLPPKPVPEPTQRPPTPPAEAAAPSPGPEPAKAPAARPAPALSRQEIMQRVARAAEGLPPPSEMQPATFDQVRRWAAERGILMANREALPRVNEKRRYLGLPPFLIVTESGARG